MSATVYEIVTDRIVKQLEKGVIPWARPWKGNPYPVSWKTQRPYRGINLWLLPPGEYATFNQIRQAGGKVIKGSKAFVVVFWKWIEKKDPEDIDKKPEKIPYLRYYNVFEINSQVEGLQSKASQEHCVEHDPVDTAEAIVTGYATCPPIRFAPGEAYYSPRSDYVSVPPMQDFPKLNEYYGTLFHELVHSTGHTNRLNRNGIGTKAAFGSESYSKEELVAELGAAFLTTEAGMQFPVMNTAAYIASWLNVLKDDRKLIVFAASAATKAADYILGKQAPSGDDEEN